MKICFYTFGCKVNQYETQVLAEKFAAQGYEVADFAFDADCDVFVVNSCTVTAQGDRKTRQLLRRLHREHPKAVVALTGCFPQAFPQAAEGLEAQVITGSANRDSLPGAIARHLATGEQVVDITPHARGERFEAMEAEGFSHHTRAFVKIEDGCENYCAYCIIPTARGPVRSKPMADLAAELESLAAQGRREVVLAGINLSAYGKDLGVRLIDAIRLAAGVPGLARVRLGSLEPDVITPEDFSQMARLGKVCPQFHLSLQSGSDGTLGRMGRRYTTAQYREVVREIRSRFPQAAITTDLMVGFPGESPREFEESCAFAREIGFAKIHVFAYSPREGTRAAAMADQVPGEEKRRRSARLIAIGEELRQSFLERMVGSTQEVLFEEHGLGSQTGYTPNYTPVTVPGDRALRGQLLPVRITGVLGDGCTGVLLE